MAKPIKLITVVKGKDADRFIRALKKTRDPKRDAVLAKARALKISFD